MKIVSNAIYNADSRILIRLVRKKWRKRSRFQLIGWLCQGAMPDVRYADEFTKIYANNDNQNVTSRSRLSRVPANSHVDEEMMGAEKKRPSTTSGGSLQGRSVSHGEGAKIGWSLRAAKQMDKKSKETSVDGEITAFNWREREREMEVCRIFKNSNHQGWYFQHDIDTSLFTREFYETNWAY